MMNYEMEELMQIVGKLVRQYTAYESTSVTYEKAEQFMEAVLYCIHENELSGHHSLVSAERIPAQQAYETGLSRVEDKVKKALELYHELLPEFVSFGNECLYDTVVKGLPEFFKWYDIQFEPQNTILTLDYPLLKDLSGYTGIDKIYEYIVCIGLEQKFLKAFPEDAVIRILARYNAQYEEMIDNLCEIVLTAVLGHILAKKPWSEADFQEEDYQHIREILLQEDPESVRGESGNASAAGDIRRRLKNGVRAFAETYCEGSRELTEYLTDAVDGIVVRLKNAAEHGMLGRVL